MSLTIPDGKTRVLSASMSLPVPEVAIRNRGEGWPASAYELEYMGHKLVAQISDAIHLGGYVLDEPYPRLRMEIRVQVREAFSPEQQTADDDAAVPGLVNVHHTDKCAGRPCVIHRPSDHHMVDWPLHWRSDRYMMERICEHGVGHPDPDHLAHVDPLGIRGEGIHGCDLCCRAWTRAK